MPPDCDAVIATLAHWLQHLIKDRDTPLLVGVGGAGGVGKSTLARQLAASLPPAALLALDHYRKPRAERAASGRRGSAPAGNDLDRLAEHLRQLAAGRPIEPPHYDPVSGTVSAGEPFTPTPLVLLDGEAVLFEAIRPHVHRLIYVESDWRLQLQTRIDRDVDQYRHPPEKALQNFIDSNRRDFPHYSAPRRATADAIVRRIRSADDVADAWQLVTAPPA
jgi:uridine kinase